jgi:polyene glycosyltransferase
MYATYVPKDIPVIKYASNLPDGQKKLTEGGAIGLLKLALIENPEYIVKQYHELRPQVVALKPDLMIADFLAASATAVAANLSIPLIMNVFSGVNSMSDDLHYQPHLIPNFISPFRIGELQTSLISRCINVLLHYISLSMHSFSNYQVKSQGLRIPKPTETLSLMNSIPGFDYAQTIPSNFFAVGPLLSMERQDADKELQKWLDEQDQDVIFLSMGTVVQLHVKAHLAHTFVHALNSSSYKVLWALKQQEIFKGEELPSNFKLQYHVPQLQVLAHPRVKLFISHCGANSVYESIYFGKPIICVPAFFDQPGNAARVVDHGLGLALNADTATASEIKAAVSQTLDNKQFTKNIERLSRWQKLAGGVSRAADIVETALANDMKVDDLIPKSSMFSWTARNMVDIYIICAVVVLFYYWMLLKCCIRTKTPKAKQM